MGLADSYTKIRTRNPDGFQMEDHPLVPKTISTTIYGKCQYHLHPSRIDQSNLVARRVSRFEQAPLFSSSLIQGTETLNIFTLFTHMGGAQAK